MRSAILVLRKELSWLADLRAKMMTDLRADIEFTEPQVVIRQLDEIRREEEEIRAAIAVLMTCRPVSGTDQALDIGAITNQ